MRLSTFAVRFGEVPSVVLPASPGSVDRRLLIVFGASDLADSTDRFAWLEQASQGATVIGCSTAGEIFGNQILDGSLTCALVDFERTTVRSAFVELGAEVDSHVAGVRLAETLRGPKLRGVLVLSDGLAVNGSELIAGLATALPEGVVVTGGLAGDGEKFERTWVLRGGRPANGVVCAVGLYGDAVRIGHGSQGGWDQFGPERVVTRSSGNVLYELDHRPALALYKQYLGERAAGLPATGLLFPLSIREGARSERRLVRTILAVDEAEQSLTFAGDIPVGAYAQLMSANFDRLIQGASDAATSVDLRAETSGAVLALAISCVGRRLVLGERAEEEIEAVLDAFPRGTQQIGFYSYGELSPLASGRCELHNQTMTLTAISEG